MSKYIIKDTLFIKDILPIISLQKIGKEITIVCKESNLLFVLKSLKQTIGYQYSLLSCISGVDLLTSVYRFSVVYDLLSLTFNNRIRVKIFTPEISLVNSSMSIYVNANWWEREIWDLFGIYFDKHQDLRRILTDYGFEGHPLRRDFPLYGYIESRYDINKKRIVTEPVQLTQDFRYFSFDTTW